MNSRIAVVTGGLGAIGLATCRALAQSNYKVIAADLPASRSRWDDIQMSMKNLNIHFEAVDVGDFKQCAQFVQQVESLHGPISVLVNNAGITRDAVLKKMEPQEWDAVIAVNLTSVFNLCRHVVDGMSERGYGRIVNISSIIGQTGQFGQSNYAAAKAGMHGFTMSLAREVARKGVTVNSVSPGYVKSAMTDAVPQDLREQILATVPVGRIGQPDDIARAVAFLCADDSSYITGINLPVNGGLFISF
ncbi:MAG: beta-ketoacyl-ACP reductase [Arenimonas sp.]